MYFVNISVLCIYLLYILKCISCRWAMFLSHFVRTIALRTAKRNGCLCCLLISTLWFDFLRQLRQLLRGANIAPCRGYQFCCFQCILSIYLFYVSTCCISLNVSLAAEQCWRSGMVVYVVFIFYYQCLFPITLYFSPLCRIHSWPLMSTFCAVGTWLLGMDGMSVVRSYACHALGMP